MERAENVTDQLIDPYAPEVVSSPGSHDGMLVMSGTDVFGDVRVLVTGHTHLGVVRLADGEEEGGVVPRRQLDDVGDQCSRTQAEHVHTCVQRTGERGLKVL